MKICRPYKEATTSQITQGYHPNHLAIDMAFKYGTFLVAPEKCIVERIVGLEREGITDTLENLKRGYGIRLRSLTEPKTYYSYWHCLPAFPVKVWQEINQGQIVAQMGNSGDVKSNGIYVPLEERNKPPYRGTHLHYSINESGIEIDPMTKIDWDIPINYSARDAIAIIIKTILNSIFKGRGN